MTGGLAMRENSQNAAANAPPRRIDIATIYPSCLLKNAIVAFFNLAKCRAKLRTARRITTYVAILPSHPCDVTAR